MSKRTADCFWIEPTGETRVVDDPPRKRAVKVYRCPATGEERPLGEWGPGALWDDCPEKAKGRGVFMLTLRTFRRVVHLGMNVNGGRVFSWTGDPKVPSGFSVTGPSNNDGELVLGSLVNGKLTEE